MGTDKQHHVKCDDFIKKEKKKRSYLSTYKREGEISSE